MNSTLEPLVFIAGVNKFGAEDDGWELVEGGQEGKDRVYRAKVTFEQELRTIPVVHLGVVGFDISNQDAARIRVRAENISTGGFDVVAETWLNSRIWSVDVSWLAIGT